MTLEATVGMFGIGDVLVHTWDLARATGLDERLDADEVHRLLVVMEPNDAVMRQGTAFGPKVPCPDDADEQTKLLAFTGRHVFRIGPGDARGHANSRRLGSSRSAHDR